MFSPCTATHSALFLHLTSTLKSGLFVAQYHIQSLYRPTKLLQKPSHVRKNSPRNLNVKDKKDETSGEESQREIPSARSSRRDRGAEGGRRHRRDGIIQENIIHHTSPDPVRGSEVHKDVSMNHNKWNDCEIY